MKILFLCVANSARSQIAEGLAKKIFPEEIWTESAGSSPAIQVHELAIQTLNEVGIDISQFRPKGIKDLPKEFMQGLDLVITLCREEQCPIIPGHFKKENWSLPDPADQAISEADRVCEFQKIRNEITLRLERLSSSF